MTWTDDELRAAAKQILNSSGHSETVVELAHRFLLEHPQFKVGDKVVVKGLDLPFVVVCYCGYNYVKLSIEDETKDTAHFVIHARPDALMLNNTENRRKEGWI